MTVYVTTRIYASTADASATGSPNATYATVRESTAATSTTGTTINVGQAFTTQYTVAQYFPIFDTSAVPSEVAAGTFSINRTSAPTAGDTLELRAVSATTNKIAGSSLAAQTPLFGSWTVVAASGRASFSVTISGMARSATCSMLLHSQKQRLGTAPSTSEYVPMSTADTTGTTDDPYLEYMPAPWSFVGVTNAAAVTATAITLTEPAGVADGDLLIACFASRSTATTAVTNTGWTAVGSQNNNNTLTTGSAIGSGTMLYQVRAGTPDLTFVIPAGISVALGSMVAYRGSAATTPLDASTAVTAAAGLAPSVTGLTTTQDDDLIVAMAAGGQEAAWSAFSNVGEAAVIHDSADKSASMTLSNGDKTATITGAAASAVRSTTAKTNGTAGKYYVEWSVIAGTSEVMNAHGLSPSANGITANASLIQLNTSTGRIYGNSVDSGVGPGIPVSGDVICMAWDTGAERIWFRINGGNWNGDASANPATGTNGVDVSFAAAVAYELYTRGLGSTDLNAASTIRGAASEFTQPVPAGFAGWSSGGPLTASGSTDTTTAPSTTAWIERADNVTTSGADTSLGIFDAVRTGTGATGNLSATASVSAGHVIIAGAFKLAHRTPDAWNDADVSANLTLSNSDKTVTATSVTAAGVRSTTTHTNGTAGKYYAEIKLDVTGATRFGIAPTSNGLTDVTLNFNINNSGGQLSVNNTTLATIGATAVNDVICFAWDAGAEKIWFRKNGGNWNNSGTANPATDVGGYDASFAAATEHALYANTGAVNAAATIRTEAAEFTQTPPSGFLSWMGETFPVADAWNVNDKSANVTLSASDKTATLASAVTAGVRSTTTRTNGVAGKYYAEFVHGASTWTSLGISPVSQPLTDLTGTVYASTTNTIFVNNVSSGTNVSSGGNALPGNVLCMAWDAGAEKIWFRINANAWNNSGGTADPATGAEGVDASFLSTVDHALWGRAGNSGQAVTIRTEAAELTQTPPSGFLSWMGETLSTPNVSVDVTGQAVTASVGTGTTTNYAWQETVAGQSAAVSVGTAESKVNVRVDVTSDALAVSIGTLTEVHGKARVDVTTNLATVSVSTTTEAQGKANVDIIGQAVTASIGDATVTIATNTSAVVTGLLLSAATTRVGAGGVPPEDGWNWKTAVPIGMTLTNNDTTVGG